MAAKSETWNYVDEHIDEFLNTLCEVVEDATKELTQLAPEEMPDDYEEDSTFDTDTDQILKELLDGFDKYDLNIIEEALGRLEKCNMDSDLQSLYEGLKSAYDNLEYEEGAQLLEDYLSS